MASLVSSQSTAALFGFDPYLLVGQHIASFLDVMRPAGEQEGER